MPEAVQIANWIVQYRAEEMGAPVDAMSLEKLIYYAQAFHLALFEAPLYEEEVRAWRHGPVVRAVYERYRDRGALPIEHAVGDVAPLGDDTESFLRDVVSVFGGLTALKLSDATHAEKPWQEARHGYQRNQPSDVHIPAPLLKTYYACLIEQGEMALSRLELLSVLDEPRWGAMYEAGVCVNRMTRHPFYQPFWAKKLSEPVEELVDLPEDLFAPIGNRDYLDIGDTRGLAGREIAARASDFLHQ